MSGLWARAQRTGPTNKAHGSRIGDTSDGTASSTDPNGSAERSVATMAITDVDWPRGAGVVRAVVASLSISLPAVSPGPKLLNEDEFPAGSRCVVSTTTEISPTKVSTGPY